MQFSLEDFMEKITIPYLLKVNDNDNGHRNKKKKHCRKHGKHSKGKKHHGKKHHGKKYHGKKHYGKKHHIKHYGKHHRKNKHNQDMVDQSELAFDWDMNQEQQQQIL
jgi:hypothetical protein